MKITMKMNCMMDILINFIGTNNGVRDFEVCVWKNDISTIFRLSSIKYYKNR